MNTCPSTICPKWNGPAKIVEAPWTQRDARIPKKRARRNPGAMIFEILFERCDLKSR
jgi:hypothetical protein